MYCSQCEQCLPQCPYNLDIPKFMRSYMYVYGYQTPYKAKETLKLADTGKIKCDQCPECNIECTMGFNIREKITDIARLTSIPEEFLV